jgi:hypothetical protein
MAYPKYRENVETIETPPGIGNWSNWHEVMVPGKDLEGYKNRNLDHEGSYNLREDYPAKGVCGIYEWKVEREGDEKVVYVGSSCNQGQSMKGRIVEYCQDGSHDPARGLINDALRKGYKLHLRYKKYNGVVQSGQAEIFLLKKYNYAWNERKNGIRAPLGSHLA